MPRSRVKETLPTIRAASCTTVLENAVHALVQTHACQIPIHHGLQVRVSSTGCLLDEQGKEVGVLRRLTTPQDVVAAEKEAGREGVVLVEALDWQASDWQQGSFGRCTEFIPTLPSLLRVRLAIR